MTDQTAPEGESGAAKELRRIKRILVGTLVAIVVAGVGFGVWHHVHAANAKKKHDQDCVTWALEADNGDTLAQTLFDNGNCLG